MNWFGTASRANIISIEVTTFLDTTIEELIENFECLGDWEERFAYLIELGKKLPPLDEIEMTDEHRIHLWHDARCGAVGDQRAWDGFLFQLPGR